MNRAAQALTEDGLIALDGAQGLGLIERGQDITVVIVVVEGRRCGRDDVAERHLVDPANLPLWRSNLPVESPIARAARPRRLRRAGRSSWPRIWSGRIGQADQRLIADAATFVARQSPATAARANVRRSASIAAARLVPGSALRASLKPDGRRQRGIAISPVRGASVGLASGAGGGASSSASSCVGRSYGTPVLAAAALEGEERHGHDGRRASGDHGAPSRDGQPLIAAGALAVLRSAPRWSRHRAAA